MSKLVDILVRAVRSRECSGLEYVEIRADDVVQTSIELRESTVESVARKSERGHSVRVLASGAWGFAVSDGLKDLGSTVIDAAKAARALSARVSSDARLSEVDPVKMRIAPKAKIPLDEVDLVDKVSHLSSICKKTVAADPRLTTAKTSYYDITGERALVTSEGTEIQHLVSHAYLMTTASAKAPGRLVSVRDEAGTVTAGWEFLADDGSDGSVVDRLVRRTRLQIEGVSCKRGSHPCVVSPRVAGMLAHEALGHMSEADLFSTGAFKGLEGSKIAPEFVSMVDSPSIENGFGNIVVDDEGVRPRTVTIIDRGHLSEQMNNREWAMRLGVEPTGNARAESYRFPPIIRMRNTYFERGDRSFDELLEGKKAGYYCADIRGGQAESNSSFQVGIQECYEIVNGELGRPVRSLAVSGVALKSLTLIDGVGGDFGFESSYCGKSTQSMPTSDGGPHMSIRKGGIVFGGSA
jgi:predicted Zn-dependent protease